MPKKTDHELLLAYDAHLTRLRTAAVFRDGILNNAKVTWRAEDPVLRTEATVEESPFLAFCVLFRPLWMNDSPQNFHRISGVLHRSSLTDKEREHLDKCCAHWKRNSREAPFYMGLSQGQEKESPRKPADWITDILGETHHPNDDEVRQRLITNINEVMGAAGWVFIQVAVLPNMMHLTNAAFGLHEIVKAVLARP